MFPIHCAFCGETLVKKRIDVPQECPRCKAGVLFTRDVTRARDVLAQSLGVDAVELQVSISPALDGDSLFLYCAWDPTEELTTVETARVMGQSRERVWKAAKTGKFVGARKAASVDTRWKNRAIWHITRYAIAMSWRTGRRTV